MVSDGLCGMIRRDSFGDCSKEHIQSSMPTNRCEESRKEGKEGGQEGKVKMEEVSEG